ncbi:protein FAR1-RELATED SEQUENCE 5-like [Fagus crenata]
MDDFFGEDFHQDFLNEEFQKGNDIQNKDQMECEASYDVLNSLEILEQDSPHDDFGDCEIKSKLYVGMHFDSLEGVEAFYREFAKNQGFGICVRSSKTTSRSDAVTNRIYVCCSEGQR